jgi:DNA mismatch endonuclease, patch repair protein
MTDVLTPVQRSRCMSAIRGKDTAPEVLLRRLLRSINYRFKTNDASLPGKPDFAFGKLRKIIFLHGCFWHRHRCKAGRSLPATRRQFWVDKLEENKKRDKRQAAKLRRAGWKVLVIWECQLCREKIHRTLAKIAYFLMAGAPEARLASGGF